MSPTTLHDLPTAHNPQPHNTSTPPGFTAPRRRLYRARICKNCGLNWTDDVTVICDDCNAILDREQAARKVTA